jgi:hypothetical protein
LILDDDDNPIMDSTAVVSNFRNRVDHLPVALGKLLTKCGFEYWDLGMELEYKRRLGAELMGRADFVTEVKRSRIENKELVLRCGADRESAKELVDWQRPCSMSNESNRHLSNTLNEDSLPHATFVEECSASKSNRKRSHDEEKKS